MKNNNEHFIEIHDVYFISEQIKRFSPAYTLCYFLEGRKWVVLDENKDIVLSSLEYPSAAYIEKLEKTSRQNFDKLIEEIEKSNLRLAKNQETAITETASDKLRLALHEAEKSATGELNTNQIKKLIS